MTLMDLQGLGLGLVNLLLTLLIIFYLKTFRMKNKRCVCECKINHNCHEVIEVSTKADDAPHHCVTERDIV